jgi:hypothetical protein
MSNKPTIPEWQRASTDAPAASPEHDEVEAQQPVEAPTPTEDDIGKQDSEEQFPESTDLQEQASRFLEDAAIRDAPREKKVAFLESKGVNHEDIESLLGMETRENLNSKLEEAGERAWSTVSAENRHRMPMSTVGLRLIKPHHL